MVIATLSGVEEREKKEETGMKRGSDRERDEKKRRKHTKSIYRFIDDLSNK